MVSTERERLMAELCRMWPRKFQDDELQDFCDRLGRFRLSDILQALNDHKNTKPFAPRVNEILARLKGKDAQADPSPKVDDFPTALRKSNEHWRDIKDNREVLLRYWRSCWFRYAMEAEKRKPDPKLPGTKAQVEMFERQWKGMRRKCEVGCTNSLSAEGMAPKQAEGYAQAIFQPPEEFRLVLMDLRGELGDPFETAA